MFQSRDPKFSIPPMPYAGPERRKGNERRKRDDRREMIRFELAKADRRGGKERRSGNWGDAQAR
ncbi:MAG: hypothetical protein EOP93_00715 [Lysobacteraceae bacterium]|nr:MAG: hypothetical protein EOP93_00715 [Xanthomonadaceae bacterium]